MTLKNIKLILTRKINKMKNNNRFFQKNIKVLSLILLSVFLSGFSISKQDKSFQNDLEDNQAKPVEISSRVSPETGSDIKDEAQQMPVYGNWETFTVKDGLPADKAYCVRIDGDRVLVGTSAGQIGRAHV